MITARSLIGLGALALFLAPNAAISEDLVYRPIIPAFGGSTDMWNYLIGSAQIQNQFAEQGGGGGGGGNAPPQINFPPITIDLGGLGNGPTVPDAPELPGIGGSPDAADNS